MNFHFTCTVPAVVHVVGIVEMELAGYRLYREPTSASQFRVVILT